MVSRCFPGGYNVKLYISRGRLAWWLLAFLHSESFRCSFSTLTVDNYSSKVTMLTLLLLQTVTAGGVRFTCGITEIFVLDGYSKYVIIPVVRTLRRRANMSSRTRAQNTLKEWTHIRLYIRFIAQTIEKLRASLQSQEV